MFLETLGANWPWCLAYVVAAVAIFVYLRRTSSTDDRAETLALEPHNFGSPTTLKRAALAFFRFRCPLMLLVLVVLAIGVRLAVPEWDYTDALVILGILAFWPVQEWIIHVFLLHMKPFNLMGREVDLIVSRNHRNHHRDPWNAELGITPPHIIWLYLAGLPAVWLLFLPLHMALTGVATYFSLVLNYEWLHFLIHTSYVPRTALYRRLWRNHRLHHFKNEHFWYGVTMLSGDQLFQTQPSAQQTARSETCLTLGVENQLADWTEPVAPSVVEAR